MKFRDNKGCMHDNLASALCQTSINKMDDWIRGKMPGYEETINENEHLYDAISENVNSYPAENDGPIVEGTVIIPVQSEVPVIMDTIVESSGINNHIGNDPVNDIDLHSELIKPELSPDVKDLLKMDHEEDIPSLQKIDIDYAQGVINLKDESGEIIATSPIDQNLTKRSIDKALLDVLYPDNNIPTDVSMNIQSKGYIPGHASKTNIEPAIEVSVDDDRSTPEVGSCG